MDFSLLRDERARTRLGESPVWDPATGDLWWVDIDGRKLLRLALGPHLETGRLDVFDTPEIPGFVVLMSPALPAVGMETGIFSFDPDSAAFGRMVAFDRKNHRFNDATVDPSGRLWASTMALDASAGQAQIHLVTEELTLHAIANGLTTPNGLAVDLERERLYYSDSHPGTQSVWFRRIKSGATHLGDISLFTLTKTLAGRPDGAALDRRGFYWIAGVDGSELYVFDLEGRLDSVIPVPFPAPTKIAFVGSGGRHVAVTSKSEGEDGGYLALAELPEHFASGVPQPYWVATPGRQEPQREES